MGGLEYFILGVIFYQIIKMLVLIAQRVRKERRDRRFMRGVKVWFPDGTRFEYFAVETTDQKAMDSVERQIRSDQSK